jgi:hypothetical protein
MGACPAPYLHEIGHGVIAHLGRFRPGSHDVPTQFKRSSSPVPTRLQRGGNFVGTLWEPVFRYRAPLRGDVFSNFFARRDVSGSLRGLCHRGCFRDRPAVTIRSLSPLISTRPKFFKALPIAVGMTWDAVRSLSQGAKILSMA